MIQNFTARGIKIEGLGFQCHFVMDQYPLDYDKLMQNFQRFNDLGIELHITELDVTCGQTANVPCQNFTNEIATQQAEMYEILLRVCQNIPNCKSFESWGFTDALTWRGSDQYPLPFDVNYQPKLAAVYIENLLLNATR